MQTVFKFIALALFVLFGFAAAAQTESDERAAEEEKRAKAFQSGMEKIVADLNKDSFRLLVRAIDKKDMIERIFGLRLIDPKTKRDFNDDMKETGRFASFIESYYDAEAKDGIRAKLLLVESRGDRGRAIVRFDMSHFRFNYVEYDLKLSKKARVIVVDWTDYYWGHKYSDRMALMMVQSQPNKNAVRKLIDYSSVREQEVFQVVEVLKAARDRNFDRYFDIVDSLSERLRRQRVVVKVGLDATRQTRKRRSQRKVLEAVAKYYPQDPLFSLALLDLYFPTKQYEEAHAALLRVRDRLHVEDAVMKARLSAATLVMGQVEDAQSYAAESIEMEPDLELGWWAVLRAEASAERYENAISALDKLKQEFGNPLDPETLGKDPTFARLLRSAEYEAWLEGDSS